MLTKVRYVPKLVKYALIRRYIYPPTGFAFEAIASHLAIRNPNALHVLQHTYDTRLPKLLSSKFKNLFPALSRRFVLQLASYILNCAAQEAMYGGGG